MQMSTTISVSANPQHLTEPMETVEIGIQRIKMNSLFDGVLFCVV
jgi:hypothetical protein